MVVDGDGECVTARTDRRLFTIVADTAHTAPGLPVPLRLSAPGFGAIDVPVSGSEAIRVTVFGRALRARSASPEVRHWLQAVLQRRDVDLVQMVEPRPLNPAYAEAGEATAFADGYPVTLASESSLRQLRDWIGEGAQSALPMDRFRPNLVVAGCPASSEDTWARFRIGSVVFRAGGPCARCAVPTIEQETAERGKEPLRTLATYRRDATDPRRRSRPRSRSARSPRSSADDCAGTAPPRSTARPGACRSSPPRSRARLFQIPPARGRGGA